MHPKTIRTALAAVLLLFLLPFPALAGQPEAGKVTRIQGPATATRGAAVTDLTRGAPVYSGDALATGPDGRLELTMADGTTLTLGGGTEFSLEGYLWNEEAGTGAALLKLSKGAFRSVTGALTAVENPMYQVQTALATIGIRGTDFWGGYLSADALDVLLVSGEHKVVVTNARGTTVLDKPGQGVTVPGGAAPLPPKVWPQAKVQKAFGTVTFKE